MATVSAKMLSPSGSNLSASKTIDTEKRTRLTVTRNSNPWIYSNYPEAIGKNGKGLALAENGYFLNQQTISGTAEVFYSHTNYTEKKLYVGIQAYNSSSKSVTVTCQNYGDSSGWNKSINAVKNFFSSKKTSVTIASGKAAWIATSQAIPADSSTPFTGMCRFETSGSVVVTVYAYQSTSAVDGNAVAFPYGLSYSADKSINHTYPAVYSGKGTGYYLTFTHGTKYVSDLLSRPYIYTSNAQGGVWIKHTKIREQSFRRVITYVVTLFIGHYPLTFYYILQSTWKKVYFLSVQMVFYICNRIIRDNVFGHRVVSLRPI